MNEKELISMLKIRETGSIRDAALALDKNPSSLSRMVRRIEEELEITMFKRTSQGLVPTPEGEVYLEGAREILELYEELKARKAPRSSE